MTMDVAGAPAALGSVKRKWWRKGAEQSKLRPHPSPT